MSNPTPLTAASIRLPGADRARGVSLIFALLTLAALSLAAVALVRSVDTSTAVIGNLGFKQDSTFQAGQAAEEAIAWLNANKTTAVLEASDAAMGYQAVAVENLDPANRSSSSSRVVVDWNEDDCRTPYASGSFTACLKSVPMAASTIPGNSARYFISRLCTSTGPPNGAGNFCARPLDESTSDSGGKGSVDYTKRPQPETVTAAPYFRIVVRSMGARNAVSFTETIVHF